MGHLVLIGIAIWFTAKQRFVLDNIGNVSDTLIHIFTDYFLSNVETDSTKMTLLESNTDFHNGLGFLRLATV